MLDCGRGDFQMLPFLVYVVFVFTLQLNLKIDDWKILVGGWLVQHEHIDCYRFACSKIIETCLACAHVENESISRWYQIVGFFLSGLIDSLKPANAPTKLANLIYETANTKPSPFIRLTYLLLLKFDSLNHIHKMDAKLSEFEYLFFEFVWIVCASVRMHAFEMETNFPSTSISKVYCPLSS